MTEDEIKFSNLMRLCKRDNIDPGAELGRKLGYSGKSAKTIASDLKSGKRKLVKNLMRRACNGFGVDEGELLRPLDSIQNEQKNTIDISTLVRLIDEQNKRIEEQGKRIDTLNDLIKSQKDLVSAQGATISSQGVTISLVAGNAQEAKNDVVFLRDMVASIQKAINENYSELKGKMRKAAETNDLKALGE